MIEQRRFAVEPWAVRECGLDLAAMGQTESVFALANGHIGLRGNLDEGDPHALPGSYLNYARPTGVPQSTPTARSIPPRRWPT